MSGRPGTPMVPPTPSVSRVGERRGLVFQSSVNGFRRCSGGDVRVVKPRGSFFELFRFPWMLFTVTTGHLGGPWIDRTTMVRVPPGSAMWSEGCPVGRILHPKSCSCFQSPRTSRRLCRLSREFNPERSARRPSSQRSYLCLRCW